MNNTVINKNSPVQIHQKTAINNSGKEGDSDHSGSDSDNDKTDPGIKTQEQEKFDKPKREPDPDTTGIDTESDKTKKEETKEVKK